MARAAVIPQSPAKRTGRTSTQSTAAAEAKKKAPRKATIATRTAPPPPNVDSDTDDELGFITTKTAAKPRGRPAGRPTTKPKATATTRGKKATPEPSVNQTEAETTDVESAPEPQVEATKKRVGRPRKNPPPQEATAPKPRGRPRVGTTSKAPTTAPAPAPTRRTRMAAEAANETKTNHIKVATNSTTMRSNLLRGPAKKKTVTFQDLSESEGEESSVPESPAAGRRRAAPKGAGAGKTGLGATPVRKPAASGTRGRKPAAAKKGAAKPLSPKKDKQVAKSLSAYASSDEEDELNTIKADIKSPVKLVVHSPVKHGLENTGLSSPVRRINFTPKKATSFVDENGEPKLPTPKHGSEGTGLSSPVRKINFTPNRSQNPVADNGRLALPPGNSINFSDSAFMSSPARRAPTSSPFKFSMRDTSNRGGSLFLDNANPISAPDFTPGHASPLKMSPKKGHLGASFSQSAFKASAPTAPARTSLFQSPAKRIASPFKSSIFSAHASVGQSPAIDSDGTPTKSVETEQTTTPKSSPRVDQHEETASEKDSEMNEDVARDIFDIESDIELSADGRTPSPSPIQRDTVVPEPENDEHLDHISMDMETGEGTGFEDEEAANLAEEAQFEYEEPETICFDAIEEANLAPEDLYDQEAQEDEDVEDHTQFENEEAETICFDAMEDAQMATGDLHNAEVQDKLDSEDGYSIQDEAQFEYEEAETLCFDAMEDEYLAEYDLRNYSAQLAGSDIDDTARLEEEYSGSESEMDEENLHLLHGVDGGLHSPAASPELVTTIEMEESDTEGQADPPVMSNEGEGKDIQLSLGRDQSTSALVSQSRSPCETSSSPTPSPPLGETTPVSTNRPNNTENDHDSTPHIRNANDIPVHAPWEEEISYTPSTQTDSPAVIAPSLFNTPSVAGQRQLPAKAGLSFTPLAQSFDRWEQNTPSQARSLRPRRRGVFSLVGPLDRTAAADTPANSGAVSYPDLSKSPLANTPSLFAELPLQPQSDGTSMSPERDQTPRPLAVYDHRPTIASPGKSTDIFEDPGSESTEPQDNHRSIFSEHIPAAEISQDLDGDDKENCGPANLPMTPMKQRPQPEELRTVHTVSKVPLKAEGDVSPLKLSRKRGLSLSATSPTRSSSRVRKPTMAVNDSAPVLAPSRRTPRASRSPTPKRRSITARRSSGRAPVMAVPGASVATASPSKKPRRSISSEQKALHGAVVHVDVHTTEGEDASGIFVELLQQMGARCVKSWSWNPSSSLSPVDGAEPKDSRVGITHVVYKDGGLRTLEKVKKAAGLVKCVGVGWVLE